MTLERTLSIIKPDVTSRNLTGRVNAMIEDAGLRIIAQKRVRLSMKVAKSFYIAHKKKPFFKNLVKFMTSGPVVVQILEGSNAVAQYRTIMGATNPVSAEPGTIRATFAKNMEANSVHGSDSLENAAREISFFFSEFEISE